MRSGDDPLKSSRHPPPKPPSHLVQIPIAPFAQQRPREASGGGDDRPFPQKEGTERFVAHSTFGDSCKRRTSHIKHSALSRGITAQNPCVIPRGPSYPEGNFGGNQLLGGSMSLSPLYRVQTNDLHVSTARPTSIAVSSDFVVTRHRSPPFGSHRTRYHSTDVRRTVPSVFVEGGEARKSSDFPPARKQHFVDFTSRYRT